MDDINISTHIHIISFGDALNLTYFMFNIGKIVYSKIQTFENYFIPAFKV